MPREGLRAGRGLSLVDGQPQAWSGSGSTEVPPTKEAHARPTAPARLAPRPPPTAAASSPCHTGLRRRRQPGLLHVLRPRRRIPTASSLPAPAARPPQPRPPADAPPIGLRAGPPDRRLRAQHLALIGERKGQGGAREPHKVRSEAVQLLRGCNRVFGMMGGSSALGRAFRT